MVNEQVFGLIMKGTHCSGLAREGLPLPPTSRPHIVLGLKMKKRQPLSSNDKKKKNLIQTWAQKMMEEKYCHLYTEIILLSIYQQNTQLSVIFLVVKMGSNYPESSWFLEVCF